MRLTLKDGLQSRVANNRVNMVLIHLFLFSGYDADLQETVEGHCFGIKIKEVSKDIFHLF